MDFYRIAYAVTSTMHAQCSCNSIGFGQQTLHSHHPHARLKHCSTSISTNAMKGFFSINPPFKVSASHKAAESFFCLLSSAFDAIKLILKPWLARVARVECVPAFVWRVIHAKSVFPLSSNLNKDFPGKMFLNNFHISIQMRFIFPPPELLNKGEKNVDPWIILRQRNV